MTAVSPTPRCAKVTLTHAAAGIGLAVLGALTGNINSGDFDKENYKGTSIRNPAKPDEQLVCS